MDKKRVSKISKTTSEAIDILKQIHKEAGHINDKEIDTFIFCFLLIAYLEKTIQSVLHIALLDSQTQEARYPELIDLILKEETFGQKIDIFKFVIKNSQMWGNTKNYINFCESINYGIRNSLFHFKMNELKYRGLDVSKIETQNKIIEDLVLSEIQAKKHIEDNIVKQKPYTKQ